MFVNVKGVDDAEIICDSSYLFLKKLPDSTNVSGYEYSVSSTQGHKLIVSEDEWNRLGLKLINSSIEYVVDKTEEEVRQDELVVEEVVNTAY